MSQQFFFDGRVKIEFKDLNILTETNRVLSCKLFLILRHPSQPSRCRGTAIPRLWERLMAPRQWM